MFSLIISIIAIALVAALAGASVYYGGEAFSNNGAKADASTLINHGQQVNGAYQLAIANNDATIDTVIANAALAQLSPKYLTSLPDSAGSTAYDVDANGYMTTQVSSEVCDEVVSRGDGDKTASLNGLFDCSVDNVTTPAAWTFGYKVL
jgi:hypothetical protein